MLAFSRRRHEILTGNFKPEDNSQRPGYSKCQERPYNDPDTRWDAAAKLAATDKELFGAMGNPRGSPLVRRHGAGSTLDGTLLLLGYSLNGWMSEMAVCGEEAWWQWR